MKKRFLALITFILTIFMVFTLCGCDLLKGKDGTDGHPGQDGKSAYQIWLDAGNTGTEQDFLAWLKGENGQPGQDGADGKDGITIVNTAYDENGNTVITYSDGSEQIIEHNWESLYVTKNPDCVNIGKEILYCTDCSLVRVVDIPALGHSYGEPTYVWDNDQCIETRVCENDNTHKETETATGVYVKDSDVTCTTPEKGHYEATFANSAIVGQTASVEKGEALGHDYTYEYNHDATCTQNGTETAICDRENCEETDTREKANTMLEHVFEKEFVFLHNDKEYSLEYCETCEQTFLFYGEELIEVDENSSCEEHHRYTLRQWEIVDCENDGIIHFECVVCGYDLVKEESLLGHIAGQIYQEEGNEIYHYTYCQREGCGKKYYLIHRWNDPIIKGIDSSLCKLNYKYICLDCEYEKNETKIKHVYNDGEIIKPATCEQSGEKTYSCVQCDDKYTKPTTALGHEFGNYELTNNPDNPCEHIAYCIRCEKSDTKTEHNYGDYEKTNNPNNPCEYQIVCSRCNDRELKVIHNYSAWIITKEATCTQYGSKYRTCLDCSEVERTFINSLGHQTEKIVVEEPTCIEIGFYKKVCKVCQEYLDDGIIKALGHEFSTLLKDDYSANVIEHWHYCIRCDYECDREEHEFEKKYYVRESIKNGQTIFEYIFYSECVICGYGGINNLGHTEKTEGIKEHAHNNDRIIDPIMPTCTTKGYGPGVKCMTCNEYIYIPEEYPALGHNYQNSICTRCGDCQLSLELSSDKSYYIVKGIGEFKGSELIIPSVYNNKPVKEIGYKAFEDCTSLTSVTIGEGVTSIEYMAFYNCDSLTSVTIGDSVTSIGEKAFEYCKSLTSVTIGDSVTSIRNYAFEYCKSLTSITIGEGVTSIRYRAFNNCTSLTSIEVDVNNPNYKSIDGNLYTKDGKTLIQYAIGKTDTRFDIPDSVTSIEDYAFAHCTSLTSVTIPDNVTRIGNYAFYYCGSLTSIIIPNSVISIGDKAFYYCTSLTSITIPDSVISIREYAFNNCTSLTSIEVDVNNPNYKSIDGNLYTKDGKTLIQYAIGKTDMRFDIPDSVTSIGSEAFYDCDSLTSVTIGDSVTRIGNYAFNNCTSLTSVIIPDSVTSIGYNAFLYCYSLTSVNYIGTIDSWVEIEFATDDSNPLNYAKKLYINGELITNANISTATKINAYAFSGCSSLTSVIIGNSVTSIGYDAFRYCTGLTSVTIGDSVTSIGNYAFIDCASLTSVVIGDSVTSIGNYAFNGCDSLTNINFNGTKEQWNAISKGSWWKYNVKATYVTCSDGTVYI